MCVKVGCGGRWYRLRAVGRRRCYIIQPLRRHRCLGWVHRSGAAYPKCVALAPAARWLVLAHSLTHSLRRSRPLTLPNSVSVSHLITVSPIYHHDRVALSLGAETVAATPPVSAVRERPSAKTAPADQSGWPRDSVIRCPVRARRPVRRLTADDATLVCVNDILN